MRRRVLIIVNPAAGGGGGFARRRLRRVVAALRRRGCSVVVRAGSAAGDAERLAREAEPGFDVVVAAGGDGTANAVANGVAAAAPRDIALLPLGTANVLAREIGLPRRADALAELIANGQARPIWPGRIGERLFLTTASSGFDAAVVAAVDPRLKRLLGRGAFAWAIALCIARYHSCELVVRVDGVEHRAATVIATKGRFYAGPHVIAPRASLAEPVLDLVLFRRAGRFAVVRYIGAWLFGLIPRLEDVVLLRCRDALITAAEPVPLETDGDLAGCLPAALGIAGQPLRLVQP